MAISMEDYYDIYTVDEYETRVGTLTSLIDGATVGGDSFLMSERANLMHQIETLKTLEKSMFKKLGVNNVQELNQRLEEYRNLTLNFSGARLENEIVGILKVKNQEEYQKFDRLVKDYIQNNFFPSEIIDFNNITNEIAEKIINKMNTSDLKNTSAPIFKNMKAFKGNIFNPNAMSKYQKEFYKKLIPELQKNVDKEKDRVEIKENRAELIFNWKEITKNLTPTEAKEYFKNNPQDLLQINKLITDKIVSMVSKDQVLIRNIINHILQKNPYAFFVGSNFNEVTGIFGEIRGLYFINKLFNPKATSLKNSPIEWRGGTHTGDNGAKPHQDILFKEFGIQIKNTTKETIEAMNAVNFSDNDLVTFIGKTGLSKSSQNLFLNYFATYNFNVPYIINEGEYKEANSSKNENFNSNREKLLSKLQDIEILLSLYAASFMYMNIVPYANQDTNVLYLIGSSFITASDILSQILKDIDEKTQKGRRFLIDVHIKENNQNIVTALNDKKREKNYSHYALENIRLTSSFKF